MSTTEVVIQYNVDLTPLAQLEGAQRSLTDATEAHTEALDAEAEAAKKSASQAEKLAKEQAAQAKATASARAALEQLADAGDKVAQATKKFEAQKKQIDALREATGDEALAAKALAAAQRQLEADLEAASEAQKKSADTAKEQAESFGDAGSRLSGFAGALDVVVPGLGSAITPLADLAGGAEAAALSASAAGVSLGALAATAALVLAPLVALGGAYLINERNLERLNAQHELENRLDQEVKTTYEGLKDAQQALALATGKLTEAQDAELTIRRQIFGATQDIIHAHDDEKKALQEQIKDTQKYIDLQRGLALALVAVVDASAGAPITLARVAASGRTFAEVMADDARAVNAALDSLTGLESGTAAAKKQIDTYNGATSTQIQILDETKDALLGTDKATRAAASAQEDLAAALALTNSLLQAEADAAKASNERYYGLLDQLYNAEQANISAREQLQEGYTQKLDRMRNEEVLAYQLTYQRQLSDLEGNLSAQETLVDAYHSFVASIDEKYEAQRTAFLDAEAQKRVDAQVAHTEALLDQQRQLSEAYAEGEKERKAITEATNIAATKVYGDFFATVSDGLAMVAEQAGATEQEVFAIRKAGALAQAVIQSAGAILTALQTPYPLTIPAVALAATAAAIQVGTIAASQPPSFRSGGLVDATAPAVTSPAALPDARLISAEVGEGILTRQGVATLGGEDGVNDVSAGISPAPTVVNLQLRHEVFDRVIVEQLGRPSALRQAVGAKSSRKNPYLVR